MIEWLDDFYGSDDMRSTLLRQFLPVFSGYVTEAVGPVSSSFIQSLAESYVDRHLGSSRAQLQEVVKGSTDPLADLSRRFDEWEAKRPEKVASNELVRSANAAAVERMRETGVTKMVWRASGGKTCPFCTELDGTVIEVTGTFFEAGDELNPEGATAPIHFESSLGHPPIHQGCVCSVEAVEETSQVPLNDAAVAKVDEGQAEHWDRNYQNWAEWKKDRDELSALPSRAEFNDLLTRNAKAIADSSDVRIRTGRDSLNSILEDGRFRSQFETGTSGGNLNPKVRAEVEEFYFGLGRKSDPTQRPIYGYLGGEGDLKRVSQYGDIIVELKSEVRDRSTVTFYDSLDAYKTNEALSVDGPSLVPRPLSNPDWRAFKPWDADQLYGDATEITTARSVPGYPEVQIHGGVSVGDIDEVIFTRGVDGRPPDYLTRQLDAAGVSWRYDPAFVKEGF